MPVNETSLPKVIWEDGRVAALLHTYAVKSPRAPQKYHFPSTDPPNRTTCLIPRAVLPTMPNGIRIRSAVFPQCIGQPDRPTDAHTYVRTDRSSTGKFEDYRPLRYESDAA